MTARIQNSRVLIVLAALAGVLAGCQSGDSAPATSAAGAPTAGGAPGSSAAGSPTGTSAGAAQTSETECPDPATGTYVRATSAHAEGNTVVVAAEPVRRVCGGPDNGHFEIEAGSEQLTLTASSTVVLVTSTPSGLGHETVAPADLPQRLVDDPFGGIFLVDGPASAVTSLEEQYHP